MSIDEIKKGLATLTEAEQREMAAFFFHLRQTNESEYQAVVMERLADKNAEHWLTPEEFEKRLDQTQ